MSINFHPWIPIAPTSRPSSFTPQNVKDDDEGYDTQRARWCIASIDTSAINTYRKEYAANTAMVQNNTGAASWGSDDMIREFLGDENSPTGRLAFKYPIMQPMHTRMVASMAGISVTPKAMAWTSNVVARRDAQLAKQLLMSAAAAMGGPLGEAVQNNTGVSPDAEATAQRFFSLWSDPYERAMTNMLMSMYKHQQLDYAKWKTASNIALSGVGAIGMFPSGNRIEAVVCDPAEVLWDPAAVKPDFTDGSFVSWCPLMDVEAIAEQYQPKADVIRMLDDWARQTPAGYGDLRGWPARRPRVFKTYFRDIRTVERGFVHVDGVVDFVKVGDGSTWTDADLIAPPENEFTATWTKAEIKAKKIRRMVQVLRYTDFIPWEYLPGAVTHGTKATSTEAKRRRETLALSGLTFSGACGDVTLAHGEYELQERDPDNVYGVEFPLKLSSWMYIGGRPIAPMSCVRDIASVMNAVMSDIMRRMSQADMPTTILDAAALAGANIPIDEAERNLKKGRAFAVQGQLAGGTGPVMQAGVGLGAEFYNHFRILDTLYIYAQNLTGVYDQNFGAPGQDQLVRVKELQNRQSGLMLSPMLFAAEHLFTQVHRFNSSAGKIFYGQRPWLLDSMVGEEGERILMSSKEMIDEQFRVEVVLSESPRQEREDARQMILAQGGYIDRQMLDVQTASELLANNALPSDVDDAAARFTKRLAEAQQQQAMQEQQQMQQMQQDAVLMEQKDKIDEREDKLAMKSAEIGAQMAQVSKMGGAQQGGA